MLFGGGQCVRLVIEVPLAPLLPRLVSGGDGAAIILPALDFDQRRPWFGDAEHTASFKQSIVCFVMLRSIPFWPCTQHGRG